jgi:leucyl/phenylalanyl-tRNA--protein transferase
VAPRVFEVTPDLLLRAYAVGIFPMADGRASNTIYWIDPEKRGILPLEEFHVPRRLRRTVRQGTFEIRCDHDFEAVLAGCAEPRPGRADTWINSEIAGLYRTLNERGHVHTVECWHEDALVGGLYGVSLGGAFFGESMFSRMRDASKVALVHLVARLSAGGYQLLDAQFLTEHLATFGAREIPRLDYRERLARALTVPATFPRTLEPDQMDRFLQAKP